MKKCIHCSFRVDKAQRPVGCHLVVVQGFEGFDGDGLDHEPWDIEGRTVPFEMLGSFLLEQPEAKSIPRNFGKQD